jgi:hypothetical protein
VHCFGLQRLGTNQNPKPCNDQRQGIIIHQVCTSTEAGPGSRGETPTHFFPPVVCVWADILSVSGAIRDERNLRSLFSTKQAASTDCGNRSSIRAGYWTGSWKFKPHNIMLPSGLRDYVPSPKDSARIACMNKKKKKKKRLKGHPIPSHPVSAGQAPVPPSGSCFLPPSWRSDSPLGCSVRSCFLQRRHIRVSEVGIFLEELHPCFQERTASVCVWWHESARLSLPLRLPWSLVVEVDT